MRLADLLPEPTSKDNPVVKTGVITVAALVAAQIVLCFAAGSVWATAYLWSVASTASGAVMGFLFGVPKVLQDETTRKAGGYRQLVNTNLDQISDWLTKVVVGLTLVNARDLSKSLQGTAAILAKALGNKDTDLALAMAVIVYFSVIGFMSVYILTRLYLSPAFSELEGGDAPESFGDNQKEQKTSIEAIQKNFNSAGADGKGKILVKAQEKGLVSADTSIAAFSIELLKATDGSNGAINVKLKELQTYAANVQ